MNDLAHILLGAALVWLGVIAGALADRIRSISRKTSTERAERTPRSRATAPARGVPVTSAHESMARDVTAALVTAGYDKAIAASAVAACAGSETATIEGWTRAALRRALKEAA